MLHSSKRLSEDVGELIMSANVAKFNFLAFDLVTQPVILDVEVLSSLGQAWVACDAYARL